MTARRAIDGAEDDIKCALEKFIQEILEEAIKEEEECKALEKFALARMGIVVWRFLKREGDKLKITISLLLQSIRPKLARGRGFVRKREREFWSSLAQDPALTVSHKRSM